MQRRIQLGYVNPYLTCSLCKGYLVDATTIVECLHSFCRSCILRHLETSYNCAKCNTEIHKTKPLEHIRSDPCLQEIVYKLVPDLYSKEETRKNIWHKANNDGVKDEPGPSLIISDDPDDVRILVTLKYFRGTSRMERIKTEHVLQMFPTRYLCCQPEMPVRVLKKFVQYKFDISPDVFQLELWRGDETLLDDLTLKQLIQIYGLFRERKPLELHYSFYPKFEPTPKPAPSFPSAPLLPPPSLNAHNENIDATSKLNDGEMLLSKGLHNRCDLTAEVSHDIPYVQEFMTPNMENKSQNNAGNKHAEDESKAIGKPFEADGSKTTSEDTVTHSVASDNSNNKHRTIDQEEIEAMDDT